MKTKNKIGICLLCLLVALSSNPLSAQSKKNKKVQEADSLSVSLSDSPKIDTDSLLRVIDSLQRELQVTVRQNDSLQIVSQRSNAKADSMKEVSDQYLSFVLNYGNSLLYRKYTSRAEDVANLLSSAPADLRQKEWGAMLALAKEMIQSSNVTQDMRTRVFRLLESVPESEQYANDIREVLRNVPAEVQSNYSLTQQAIRMIDAMPKTVTDKDDRFAIVRKLLLEYKSANEEIKTVLRGIQNDPNNSINISEAWRDFENRIKYTSYYKRYYGEAWNIPYLNSIIDDALSRLHGATQRVNFEDLIKNL